MRGSRAILNGALSSIMPWPDRGRDSAPRSAAPPSSPPPDRARRDSVRSPCGQQQRQRCDRPRTARSVAGIVALLQYVETQIAGFLYGGFMISAAGLDEGVNVFRFHLNLYQRDVHSVDSILGMAAVKPRRQDSYLSIFAVIMHAL